MPEAICSRHYRSFNEECYRCKQARYINEAAVERARERARREAEFARMALVPKTPPDSPSSGE